MGKVNVDELDWSSVERGETHLRRKQLSATSGGEDLGCSLYELPPGKRSWPFHYHTGNEEAIFVLEGEGRLRLGEEETGLRAGDYVALPGREDHAHRIINDSNEPLRYLVTSTMNDPDVLVYPDSDKIGVFTGSAPGAHEKRILTKFFPASADVSYWQEEEDS